MKKSHLFFAVALILGLSACGHKHAGAYVNKEKKFKITYPQGWEVRENELGMDVIGLMPLLGDNDAFRENVYVASSPMEKPLDPDGVLDAMVPSMVSTITDFQTVSRGVKTIGPLNSAWLKYTSRQGKFKLTGTVYAVVKDGRAYLIYTIAEIEFEPLFKDDFDKIAQSFEAL